MLSIGIVGLPNVGKSTLFQALTQKQVDIADYPFTTIDPNVGVVAVPDERLEKIVALIKPDKSFPAVVEFVDIAGLVKGAHKGEGLGNKFLSHIFGVDAILFLLKCFNGGSPSDEINILKEELQNKDKEIAERGTEVPSLAQKPSFIACNVKSDPSINSGQATSSEYQSYDLTIDAKLELEISEMSPEEIKELGLSSSLPQLINKAYKTLDLISFYTIKGGKEVRAWPAKIGTLAPNAGGIVHADFKEKFIRAEVIKWDKLLEAGSLAVSAKQSNPWAIARDKGWLRTEGRNYAVQDGDVMEFKI